MTDSPGGSCTAAGNPGAKRRGKVSEKLAATPVRPRNLNGVEATKQSAEDQKKLAEESGIETEGEETAEKQDQEEADRMEKEAESLRKVKELNDKIKEADNIIKVSPDPQRADT